MLFQVRHSYPERGLGMAMSIPQSCTRVVVVTHLLYILWTLNRQAKIFLMMMMMNCFWGMVDRRKAFSLISSPGHCERSLPSRISNTPRAGFEPEFRLCRIKLRRSDNHYIMSPQYKVLYLMSHFIFPTFWSHVVLFKIGQLTKSILMMHNLSMFEKRSLEFLAPDLFLLKS